MAYEYRSRFGLIRLAQAGSGWRIELGDEAAGAWPSAEAAISALRRRASGIAALDRADGTEVPDDLLRWTPLADNL